MSLFRSASGPSGLSINTTAANAGGATSQAPAAGGLFGGGAAGGLFGGGQQNQTPNTTGPAGGLFGTANTQPAQQGTAGGLFGTANTQPAQQGTAGGLFGNTGQGQQQQTMGAAGGLFGGAAATQNAGAAGGLFGAANTQTQQQPQQPAGGLFGAANTQQTQQQPAAGGLFASQKPGGLFGGAAATTTPPATGGLFAAAQQTTTQAPATGLTGLFGSAPAQQQQQPTASGLLGQNTGILGGARPGQAISATQINYDTMQGRTRFDDLAKPIQDEIATIDAGVQRIMTMQKEIAAFMPKQREVVDQLTRDVQFVQAKFKRVERVLRKDVTVVNALKEATKADIDNAQITLQAVENLKLPAQYHTPNLWAPNIKGKEHHPHHHKKDVIEVANLIGLFNKAALDLEARHRRLTEYRAEIASHLPNVENGLYERVRALRDGRGENDAHSNSLKSILETIETLHDTILALASQCVKTRDQLEAIQVKLPPIGLHRGREVN